jgi:hypothetical protein
MDDTSVTILVVDEQHEQRAAEFCRRHRHRDLTTSEAMDDLAAEFEKVAREARSEVVRWLREHGGGEGDYWADRVRGESRCSTARLSS